MLGEIAEINCSFESANSDFFILWKEGPLTHRFDEAVTKRVDRRIFTIGTNGRSTSLQITNTTFKDAGNYTCYKYPLQLSTLEKCEWLIIVQGM